MYSAKTSPNESKAACVTHMWRKSEVQMNRIPLVRNICIAQEKFKLKIIKLLVRHMYSTRSPNVNKAACVIHMWSKNEKKSAFTTRMCKTRKV